MRQLVLLERTGVIISLGAAFHRADVWSDIGVRLGVSRQRVRSGELFITSWDETFERPLASVGAQVVVHLVSLCEGLLFPVTSLPVAAVASLAAANMLFRDMLVQLIHGLKGSNAVPPKTNQLQWRFGIFGRSF